ncbi:MAG: Gfo/Idh/MocA family protein [Opitutales bacterium]
MSPLTQASEANPRVALVGLEHGHAEAWLRQDYGAEIDLVGIYEPDLGVAESYRGRHPLEEGLFYTDLEKMLDAVKPDAVWAFTSTLGHERVVEVCGPRGIDVIVEKPLAVNFESAQRIEAWAKEYGIRVWTSYETSFHQSVLHALEFAKDTAVLGSVHKVVSHFGHKGPIEIGVPAEFGDWLTDPVLNGGGASADFGCYGANLMNAFTENQRPRSVTAFYRQLKPEVYSKVDDDATIVLEYADGLQAIIQASWNWPYSRKDIQFYGTTGAIHTVDRLNYKTWTRNRRRPQEASFENTSNVWIDSIRYFAAVLRGEIEVSDGLASLENNVLVAEIMDAAKVSARSGKPVILED